MWCSGLLANAVFLTNKLNVKTGNITRALAASMKGLVTARHTADTKEVVVFQGRTGRNRWLALKGCLSTGA